MDPQHPGDFTGVSEGEIPDNLKEWVYPAGGAIWSSPDSAENQDSGKPEDDAIHAIDADTGIVKGNDREGNRGNSAVGLHQRVLRILSLPVPQQPI